jgi:hypothetical protein
MGKDRGLEKGMSICPAAATLRIRMLIMTALAGLLLCGCAEKFHMVAREDSPAFAPKPDKALLVIIRTATFNGDEIFNNYLDGRMIGQTRGRTAFLTDVAPGRHYVTSRAENVDTIRLNFEAGRIYFLLQGIYPGWTATSRFTSLTIEEFKKEASEAEFFSYDAVHPGKDLSIKEFTEAKNSAAREGKDESRKELLEYRGYLKAK